MDDETKPGGIIRLPLPDDYKLFNSLLDSGLFIYRNNWDVTDMKNYEYQSFYEPHARNHYEFEQPGEPEKNDIAEFL